MMRRSNLLLLCLLGFGCGGRTDAFGDEGSLALTGGSDATEPQGIGGVVLGTGGAMTMVRPTPVGGTRWGTVGSTWGWGGAGGTVIRWTGQGGWGGVGGAIWATTATGGTRFATTIWGGAGGSTTRYTTATGGSGGAATRYTTATGGSGGSTTRYTTATGGSGGAATRYTTATGGSGGAATRYTTATGGSGGAAPSTSIIAQTCAQLAQTSCQQCLCNVCAEPAIGCLTDAGCLNIVACVLQTNCLSNSLLACYAASTCKTAIDNGGGLFGASLSKAGSVASCLVTSGCSC